MANADKKYTEKYSNGNGKASAGANAGKGKTTTQVNAESTQSLIQEQVNSAKNALKNNMKREIIGGAIRECFAELAQGDFGDASAYLDIISDFTESIESNSLAIEAYECKGNFLLNASEMKSESELKEVVILEN